MLLVDRHRLYGTGIGWIDAHLLASTKHTADCLIWTRDRRLARAADELGIAAEISS